LDRRPNALGVLHDLVRAEADNAPPLAFHQRCAPHIGFRLIGVMMTVDFDDQLFRHTSEVGEVRPDGMLTTELDAIHSMRADQLPADPFAATGIAP